MARVLIDGEWCEEITQALSEGDFEAIVVEQADSVYPDHHVVPFKKTVESDEGTVKADLALIHKHYREWWVVEVEMAHHSFDSHVLPQVRKLTSADYGTPEATYLCGKAPILDAVRTSDLVRGTLPRVLVIVNTPRPDWVNDLARYNAELAVFEVFRSGADKQLFRVNGYRLEQIVTVIAPCSLHPVMPTLLVVESPNNFVTSQSGKVNITHRGLVSEWHLLSVNNNEVWLYPLSARNRLLSNTRYELVQLSDGSFEIR